MDARLNPARYAGLAEGDVHVTGFWKNFVSHPPLVRKISPVTPY